MNRRALQVVNGLVGLVTVGLGTAQLSLGLNSPLYAAARVPQSPVLDSNLLLAFTLVEVIGAPLLIYWQHQLATSKERSSG